MFSPPVNILLILLAALVAIGPILSLLGYCIWLEIRRAQRIKRFDQNIAFEARELPGFEVQKDPQGTIP